MGSQISPNPNPWSSSKTLVPQDGDYNATFFKNLGYITIESERYLVNRAGGVFDNDQVLKNYGAFDNNDGATLNNWGNIYNTGQLFNSIGGIYNNNQRDAWLYNSGWVQNNGTMNIDSGEMYNSLGGMLLNKGTLLVNNGKFCNGYDYESPIKKNGTLINDGLIQIAEKGTFVNQKNGLLMGYGSTDGDITNYGVINGGKSAGGYLIEGDLEHGQGGKVMIELGGSNDANRDRKETEYDFLDIDGDLIINGGSLDVSLIDNFRIQRGQEFIITRLEGELTGHYDGLEEGGSIGQFESIDGKTIDLHISYAAGDGNDVSLYTDPLTNPEMIFGYI